MDANGVHVSGQSEWGHCGSGCPVDDAGRAKGGSRPRQNNVQFNSGGGDSLIPRQDTIGNHFLRSKVHVSSIGLKASLHVANVVGGTSFTKKKCPSPSKCRPVVQCGAYLSPNQLTSTSRSCTQDNGATGVCCNRFTRNKSELDLQNCQLFHLIRYPSSTEVTFL